LYGHGRVAQFFLDKSIMFRFKVCSVNHYIPDAA